ncbi:MAG TPA: Ig-like domain-containing protein [Kofleriaceae bacterium]
MSCTRSFTLIALPLAILVVAGCSDGNQTPIVAEQQATTDEDVPVDLNVLDGARDPDGDKLTVTSASAGGHRVEIIDQTTVRLTPMRDFNGTIRVDYEVSDGVTAAVPSHVTVTVRPVNDPPVATGGDRNIHGSDPVTLEGTDVDGDKLTFTIVANPKHGKLAGDAPALQYTPDSGFIGDDAIMYTVSDGTATSQPAMLALHVSPGAAPVATAAEVSVDEDHQLAVTLRGTDVDGDALSFTVETQPEHGKLDGTPPNLSYTPDPDFNGDDALEFTVSDGYLTSNKSTVAIHVAAVNDPPVATPQAVAAVEDTSIAVTLGGSDVDGDAVSFRLGNGPSHGTLSALDGATVTYTPARDYHGPDSFTFTAVDGLGAASNPATIDLNVASVDDPPVAMSFARTLNEDTPNAITLVGSDVDADPLSFTIADGPSHGVLSGDPPNVTYTPSADYNGDDSFTYTVSDGTATSDPGTVTLHVTPVNDRPVAVNTTVTTDEDTAVNLTLQASDVDSSNLTYTIVTPPADGTLTGSGATRRYLPAGNVNGTRSLTFRVSDGSLTADATVTITIDPVNDPPTAAADFTSTDPGTALTYDVVANDSDIDGDTVTLDAVDPPAHGTAVITDGKLAYTPNAGFTGIELVGYTVGDGHGGTAHGTVHLGVGTFPPGAPQQVIAAVTDVDVFFSGRERMPSLSDDGRYVAFTTPVALVGADTNNANDIYVYDRSTRSFTLVSKASDGRIGNGNSAHARLSGDGRYVVFQSDSNNLVPGDSNGRKDVFRHDRVTGGTIRVSVASDGTQANNDSFTPEISGDGNLVVFASSAFNLVASDANGTSDIFVRDVAAGTTERISVGRAGGDADLDSTEPAISRDGHFVAFTSSATNLVDGDNNAHDDIFVRDRIAGTTTRVSVSTNGGEANSDSRIASISRDGRFVSFLSFANNLVPGTGSGTFVRDQLSQTTTVPPIAVPSTRAQLSGDGRFLVNYSSSLGVCIADRFGGGNVRPGFASWLLPAISDNAQYIATLDTSNGGRLLVIPNPIAP